MFRTGRKNLPGRIFILSLALCSTFAKAQLIDTDGVLGGLPDIEVELDDLDELRLDEVTSLDQVTESLAPVAGLGSLPLRLEIPSLNGGTALVEVEVEDGWRAIEREWLLIAEAASLVSSSWSGIEILEKQTLPGLGLHILRVRVDEKRDSYKNLRSLFASGAVKTFDRNHVFEVQVSERTKPAIQKQPQKKQPTPLSNIRIGMVDTAVSSSHPSLQSAKLERAQFVAVDIEEAEAHGTAVASLIVGRNTVNGMLPDAELYAASVFYSRHQRSQGASSFSLLKALDWLVTKNVSVINMSLAGPPNVLLQSAIKRAWEKGIPVVAAVGNAGPMAPPLYPAAWQNVIAVTAVDEQAQIYRWAVQGAHVDFSARGVAVQVARVPDSLGIESGTSLATPLVTCLLAKELALLTKFPGTATEKVEEAIKNLQAQAQDLGEQGKDKVFGFGFLRTH